eukprot:CAMPEP_0204902644 /NCGR_PEP_ID=MMETSP1397-20131031/3790_1 /ASSEMBLY_ACC=CAM_ASM_000891 /TAXON_ID=49980 /ORGANISM="Climacostomum Climacostomum virens, Strain Stock W-24" /LENGTH=484 /DNA_ID=CAMNT_0052071179 /DNA_START=2503 /DNA_END=3957 /DNA_ORIENTATION=-
MGCCSVKFNHIALEGGAPIKKGGDLPITANQFVVKRYDNIEAVYILERELGRGSFGKVTLARHKETGMIRAVKTIGKSPKDFGASMAKFCEEVEILKRIDHPNVIKIYEFYEDERSIHLATEYVDGGPLYELIVEVKKVPEQVAAHIIKQLLGAMLYCHSNHIVHRDLKLENILLDEKSFNANLKVIDFGLSTLISTNQRLTQCLGSAYYMAPEVFEGDYDEKCDIWSCGVLMYIILSGKLPFKGLNTYEVMHRAREGNPPFTDSGWAGISTEAVTFIKKMLCPDPKLRISAAAALQDNWLKRWRVDKSLELITLKSLNTFHAPEKLQHAVLTVIAAHLGKSEEAKRLGEQFRMIDQNSDGRLSKEEIYTAYATYGNSLTLTEVGRILNDIDINGSGFIDFTEFLMACMRSDNFSNEANLKYAFAIFDIDNSKAISAVELRRVLGREVLATDEVWEEIIQKVDRNRDGEIDFDEFKTMVQKVLR